MRGRQTGPVILFKREDMGLLGNSFHLQFQGHDGPGMSEGCLVVRCQGPQKGKT